MSSMLQFSTELIEAAKINFDSTQTLFLFRCFIFGCFTVDPKFYLTMGEGLTIYVCILYMYVCIVYTQYTTTPFICKYNILETSVYWRYSSVWAVESLIMIINMTTPSSKWCNSAQYSKLRFPTQHHEFEHFQFIVLWNV